MVEININKSVVGIKIMIGLCVSPSFGLARGGFFYLRMGNGE